MNSSPILQMVARGQVGDLPVRFWWGFANGDLFDDYGSNLLLLVDMRKVSPPFFGYSKNFDWSWKGLYNNLHLSMGIEPGRTMEKHRGIYKDQQEGGGFYFFKSEWFVNVNSWRVEGDALNCDKRAGLKIIDKIRKEGIIV